MRKIKNLLLIFTGMLISLFLVAPAAPAYAAIKDDIQAGACGAAGQPQCAPATATRSLSDTIAGITNVLSIVAGIAAVIMLIVGGIRYVTSAGNEQAVAGAKKTIMYALIGLLIVALAQVIVRFVLRRLFT